MEEGEIIAAGPIVRGSTGPYSRIVLRRYSDDKCKLSTDILEENGLVPDGGKFSTLYSCEGRYSSLPLAETVIAFASRIELSTPIDLNSPFASNQPKPYIVDPRLFLLLGWTESMPTDIALRIKLKDELSRQLGAFLQCLKAFKHDYSIVCVFILCAFVWWFVSVAFASVVLVAVLITSIIIQPQLANAVQAVINFMLARRSQFWASEVKSRQCSCGAFDLRQFGVQPKSQRVCPKCFPRAAIAGELNHPDHGIDADSLYSIVFDYFGAKPAKEADLRKLDVVSTENDLLAYGPWQQIGDETLRFVLRWTDHEYVVAIESKTDSTGVPATNRIKLRTDNYLDAIFNFTISLKFLAGQGAELSWIGPYYGATSYWSCNSFGIQDTVNTRQKLDAACNSLSVRFWSIIVLVVGSIVILGGAQEPLERLISQTSEVVLFVLSSMVLLGAFFIEYRVRYFLTKQILDDERMRRTCVFCGFLDVSPDLPYLGYARPCPLCFFGAAKAAAIRKATLYIPDLTA